MKIKVEPEGREGIYLISKKEAVKMINNLPGDTIHHQFQGGGMFIGADHDKSSVLEDIEKSDKMAILTEPNFTLGHQFVVIVKNKRNAFDVGKITKDDLKVKGTI